jgi:hypothetical protein
MSEGLLALGAMGALALAGAARGAAARAPLELTPTRPPVWHRSLLGRKGDAWFKPGDLDLRIRRSFSLQEGQLYVTWAVFKKTPTEVRLAGMLAAHQISDEDNRCASAMKKLKAQTGAPIRGLMHVASVEFDKDIRGLGLARVLYRDLVLSAARHGLAAGPGACYAEEGRWRFRGSTKPKANQIWEDLSLEFPHATLRNRFILWGGTVGSQSKPDKQPLPPPVFAVYDPTFVLGDQAYSVMVILGPDPHDPQKLYVTVSVDSAYDSHIPPLLSDAGPFSTPHEAALEGLRVAREWCDDQNVPYDLEGVLDRVAGDSVFRTLGGTRLNIYGRMYRFDERAFLEGLHAR